MGHTFDFRMINTISRASIHGSYFEDGLRGNDGFYEINGDKYPNLIEKQMGDGKLVLHSTPLVFTNYHFRK